MKNSPERNRRAVLTQRASINSDPSRGCDGKERFVTYGQAARTAKNRPGVVMRPLNVRRATCRCRR